MDNYHAIESDICRTFIAPCFKRGNKKHQALWNILTAFANKFPSLGYVQGMNSIAAVITLNFSNQNVAFYMFSYLLNDLKLCELLGNDFKTLKRLFI